MKFLRALRRLARARSAPIRLAVALTAGAVATACVHPAHDSAFLACTRGIESHGDYQAVNPAGPYWGAYQFLQSTWDETARHAGWLHLVGVRPDQASVFEQDAMAQHLYEWQGKAPWNGRC
jgi:hypothetical protein